MEHSHRILPPPKPGPFSSFDTNPLDQSRSDAQRASAASPYTLGCLECDHSAGQRCNCASWCSLQCPGYSDRAMDMRQSHYGAVKSSRPPSPASSVGSHASGISHPPGKAWVPSSLPSQTWAKFFGASDDETNQQSHRNVVSYEDAAEDEKQGINRQRENEAVFPQRNIKYPCLFSRYGCSKRISPSLWLRHVRSVHLCLGFYRCDLGRCNFDSDQRLPKESLATGGERISPTSNTTQDGEKIAVYKDFHTLFGFRLHCRRKHKPILDDDERMTSSLSSMVDSESESATDSHKLTTDRVMTAFETDFKAARLRCFVFYDSLPSHATCEICKREFPLAVPGIGSLLYRLYVEIDNKRFRKGLEANFTEYTEHVLDHYKRDEVSQPSEPLDQALRAWAAELGLCREQEVVTGVTEGHVF